MTTATEETNGLEKHTMDWPLTLAMPLKVAQEGDWALLWGKAWDALT